MDYRGPHRVRIEEKPYPEILHPGDAIVRVLRSCICGSDLHLYNGMVPDTRVGMTFGHEFIGVVEEIGDSVTKLKKGDKVIVDHLDYRLDFVRNYALCEAYNFKDMDDPVLFLKKTTDWYGADVCIDAVGGDAEGSFMQTLQGKKLKLLSGSSVALQWAINSVKKGGIISIVGVYGPTANLVPIGNVVNKSLTIRGAQASVARLLPRLIKHVMDGILEPGKLITHKIPLREVSEAYRMFSAKLDNMIKPVLIPETAY